MKLSHEPPRVVMTGLLGPDVQFRIVAEGAWDPKAIGRTIRHLELVRDHLREDEERERAENAHGDGI